MCTNGLLTCLTVFFYLVGGIVRFGVENVLRIKEWVIERLVQAQIHYSRLKLAQVVRGWAAYRKVQHAPTSAL